MLSQKAAKNAIPADGEVVKSIVSTNLMPEAIAQRYSGQIASRIEGEYQLLPFVGEDIRVLKKKRGL